MTTLTQPLQALGGRIVHEHTTKAAVLPHRGFPLPVLQDRRRQLRTFVALAFLGRFICRRGLYRAESQPAAAAGRTCCRPGMACRRRHTRTHAPQPDEPATVTGRGGKSPRRLKRPARPGDTRLHHRIGKGMVRLARIWGDLGRRFALLFMIGLALSVASLLEHIQFLLDAWYALVKFAGGMGGLARRSPSRGAPP